jgi:hypothetical protein
MLRDLCHRIEILNKYYDNGSAVFKEAKEACFEIALTLLTFVFAIIKFIREDGEYSSLGELCFLNRKGRTLIFDL